MDERYRVRGIAAGEPIEFPVNDADWLAGPEVAAGDVFGLYREQIARANAIIATAPLDTPARCHNPRWTDWGWPPSDGTMNLAR